MSQGLIRLKKVKVAPKRNLSIIKKTVYKKQLSVRFEDQRPMETIKHLSQDIDELSQVIDAYFPLRQAEAEPSSLLPQTDSKVRSFRISEISNKPKTTNFASNLGTLSGHSGFRSDETYSSFASEGAKDTKKIELNDLSDSKNSTVSKHLNQVDLRVKYKNMAPAEEYGFDFRVVKNGGRGQLNDSWQCSQVVEMDLVTPKIIKQTKPTKRTSKIKRRNFKDVLVAT